ncbi:putative nuclease YigB [Escherichia coli]|uniref:Putative nuclease YigB n=1 Tax=Escherichia coli TaxID=562 RepID=A0A376YJV1_ECOLX|nr:putative nuclease YigB [Escherichia coli]
MRKYIPLVLFIFSWPVLSCRYSWTVVRVLDGDTIGGNGLTEGGADQAGKY